MEGIEEGLTASGWTVKKRRNRAKHGKQNDEARNHCRNLILDWFRKHNMVYLEKQYLNDDIKGLDLAKTKLKLLLLEGTAGDEFQENRDKSKWSKWIEEQVVGTNGLKNKWWKQSTIQQ